MSDLTSSHKLDKFGYYRVKNKIIRTKVEALVEGTKENYHPDWIFNNDVFNAFDWKTEPTESFAELYRQRAQQIRDQYDHVALSFSGGADSTNILRTFLDNDIRLDEIVAVWDVKQSESRAADSTDPSATNVASEWLLTLKPKLEWIAKHHPEIKITIIDWAEDLHKVKISDDFLLERNHQFCPYGGLRWDRSFVFDRIGDKKGVVVSGVDKPRINIHNSWYNLYFVDAVAHNAVPWKLDNKQAVELFYWDPSCCKMLAKQVHAIVKFFEQYPQFQSFLTWPNKNPQHKQFYETAVRSIIYPHVDNCFQTNKPVCINIGQDRVVFGTELEEEYRRSYNNSWQLLQSVVDARYFSTVQHETTLIGFINGMWPIKQVNSGLQNN